MTHNSFCLAYLNAEGAATIELARLLPSKIVSCCALGTDATIWSLHIQGILSIFSYGFLCFINTACSIISSMYNFQH